MRWNVIDARSGVVAAALLLSGCAGGATQGSAEPPKIAEKITWAVYADNFEAVLGFFDDDLKKQVTRTDLGSLSDAMHRLGEIKSVTERSAEPDKGRYDYDVAFERGKMIARIRLDPSGKVGAYRLETIPG
jgi:hypothetical protein